MKNLTLAASLLIATFAITTSGQVKSVTGANNQPVSKQAAGTQNSANSIRPRVSGQKAKVSASDGTLVGTNLQAHAKSDSKNGPEAARLRRTSIMTDTTPPVAASAEVTGSNNLKSPASNDATAPASIPAPGSTLVSPSSTQVYRVGPRDVLDIQLVGNPSRESTLFTVLDEGLLEYPLAGDPIAVVGLTTAEIATLLRQRIKIFDNPAVAVNVRDYASHSVTVTGFVAAPGRKILRREAVPLYALLAEALVLPEAARATITRQGRPAIVADLKDPNHSITLIIAGDVIKVAGLPPAPTEFFFIGGAINSPGQKPYHAGLTLTQAILASGGTNVMAGFSVRISRIGENGRLIGQEHNLRRIQLGKVPDPVVQKGDRIEVMSAN